MAEAQFAGGRSASAQRFSVAHCVYPHTDSPVFLLKKKGTPAQRPRASESYSERCAVTSKISKRDTSAPACSKQSTSGRIFLQYPQSEDVKNSKSSRAANEAADEEGAAAAGAAVVVAGALNDCVAPIEVNLDAAGRREGRQQRTERTETL